MRLILIATGDIALPAFRSLLEAGPKPMALVTQPDKPVGRKQVMTPPAVKCLAEAAGIPVLQPERIADAAQQLAAMEPEVIVVMAYGQILREELLGLARIAIINLHASLLPKYRGAACIQAAIDAGDAESGITVQHVVRKLDAGDLILTKRLALAADETGGSLHDRLADLAVPALHEVLELLASGIAPRVPQDEAASSYIGKLGRDDGRLDWALSARQLERRIRAYDPWPGTYTVVQESGRGCRIKVFPPTRVLDAGVLPPGEVQCEGGRLIVGTGEGDLELFQVQPDGGRRMTVEEYLRAKSPERMG